MGWRVGSISLIGLGLLLIATNSALGEEGSCSNAFEASTIGSKEALVEPETAAAADGTLANHDVPGSSDIPAEGAKGPLHFRFHVLAVPHTISTTEMSACAYTQKVIRFCNGMTARGHTVYHYGHARSQVNATEHVTVTNNEVLKAAYGDFDWKRHQWKYDLNDHTYQFFRENAVSEMAKRCRPGDIVLAFFGLGHKATIEAAEVVCHGLIAVEPGIGYEPSGIWAPYRVFESYNTQARYYHTYSPSVKWYDVVIPNSYDPDEFEFSDKKKGYCLYLARLNGDKGLHVTIQMTKAVGCKLIIGGQGSLADQGYTQAPSHVTELGYVGPEQRRELLRDAKVLIMPTFYEEPFGGVVVEAMLSGTPVITTDWGAFAENVLHGVTGYRCRTWPQFLWALENVDKLNPHACRKWAVENFNLSHALDKYEQYFETLVELHKQDRQWYFSVPNMTEYDIPAVPGVVVPV